MKQSKSVRAISVFMTCLLVGCASYTPTLVRLNPSGPNVTRAGQGDLKLYIEEYATPEKSEVAFDTEMAEEGVLPLLIQVANSGQEPFEVKAADILVRGDTELKPLSPAEAADKASRGAVGRAIGWSLLVPIIAIPIAAAASATHTSKVNKQIVHDFSNKAFEDGAILPHQDRSGFLFFELQEGRKDLDGLTLELTAKNVTTGEVETMAAPLPAATFPTRPPMAEESPEHMEAEQFEGAKVEQRSTPTEARDWVAQADTSMRKGDYDAAIKEYQAALNVDASDQPAQEGLSRARSAKQAAAKSTHWLMGKWVGIREDQWFQWDTTIRITSYDQATHAFKGNGYLLDKGGGFGINPSRKDLVIKGVIDEKGRVVMTTDDSNGRSSTFNLKRTRDGRLSGTTAYGLPRLSLEKK